MTWACKEVNNSNLPLCDWGQTTKIHNLGNGSGKKWMIVYFIHASEIVSGHSKM